MLCCHRSFFFPHLWKLQVIISFPDTVCRTSDAALQEEKKSFINTLCFQLLVGPGENGGHVCSLILGSRQLSTFCRTTERRNMKTKSIISSEMFAQQHHFNDVLLGLWSTLDFVCGTTVSLACFTWEKINKKNLWMSHFNEPSCCVVVLFQGLTFLINQLWIWKL